MFTSHVQKSTGKSEHDLYTAKVCDWCAISHSEIIRPYYLDYDTVVVISGWMAVRSMPLSVKMHMREFQVL